ncbi:hypothetical protein OAS43_01510 [Candidatus Pelagibacter sp.]|nr:hypothetical protein [Candidatus Pelagibacter sp.]
MIKKITFTLVFCCLLISCGKKGDPEYKNSKKKIDTQNIIINKA